MAAHDPRARRPAPGSTPGTSQLGRTSVVRVAAPANDNRAPFIHVARVMLRLMCLAVAIAAVAVILR